MAGVEHQLTLQEWRQHLPPADCDQAATLGRAGHATVTWRHYVLLFGGRNA